MTFPLRPEDFYHTGIVVADLHAAPNDSRRQPATPDEAHEGHR